MLFQCSKASNVIEKVSHLVIMVVHYGLFVLQFFSIVQEVNNGKMVAPELAIHTGQLLLQALGCQSVRVGQVKLMLQLDDIFDQLGDGYFDHAPTMVSCYDAQTK